MSIIIIIIIVLSKSELSLYGRLYDICGTRMYNHVYSTLFKTQKYIDLMSNTRYM